MVAFLLSESLHPEPPRSLHVVFPCVLSLGNSGFIASEKIARKADNM